MKILNILNILVVLLFLNVKSNSHDALDTSIVFIHIGNSLPTYLANALEQARLFNPQIPIVLLANQKAIEQSSLNITKPVYIISIESLEISKEHEFFIKNHRLNEKFREGFWRYAFERFYCLYDFMKQYNASHVFHLEYDNMLYMDGLEAIPVFESHYDNCIGATFDNDQRCIAGFIYIPNKKIMKQLVAFMNQHLGKAYNDMQMLGYFKRLNPEKMHNLPIIPAEYATDYELISPKGHKVKTKEVYYQNSDEFGGIFDAAALGQYLGGIDPRNGPSKPGFINESCIFNPSQFSYIWIKDEQNRKVPFIQYKENLYHIFNLHIHSKQLHLFSSM